MTNKEKELLLIDLCARLPYGVMCNIRGIDGYDRYIVSVDRDNTKREFEVKVNSDEKEEYMPHTYPLEDIKLYLRPISSMTEEEKKEYKDMNVLDNCDEFSNIKKNIEDIKKNGEENYIQLPRAHAQDYLNSIHVDYRGLIEKGLALEAPEGMYEF